MDKTKNKYITALVANEAGEIFELDGYAAAGMSSSEILPLSAGKTCNMPHGSELMYLPGRQPIVFNLVEQKLEALAENPYEPGETLFPVAAFNSPGYIISSTAAYAERKDADILPLFSYGAVGWYRGNFRSAVILVDPEKRQDLRLMQREDVIAGVEHIRKRLPGNRLREHLEKCALEYGCPAGKNFFLGRYEAPLPTSNQCNARCLGCLSLQKDNDIPCSQDRIDFTPSPEEIVGVALAHIRRTPKSVVSFGQGCEGDPLLAAHVIEPAVRKIRMQTNQGTINLNTNASLPQAIEQIIAAGLDSMRVSLNSVREDCYNTYFRPKGYRFGDVLTSIEKAIQHGIFVSINYLNMPGFTDTPKEIEALIDFMRWRPINMIQWRNLNFDPLRYYQIMNRVAGHGQPVGTEKMLQTIREVFPKLKFGYFNPPKEKFFV